MDIFTPKHFHSTLLSTKIIRPFLEATHTNVLIINLELILTNFPVSFLWSDGGHLLQGC